MRVELTEGYISSLRVGTIDEVFGQVGINLTPRQAYAFGQMSGALRAKHDPWDIIGSVDPGVVPGILILFSDIAEDIPNLFGFIADCESDNPDWGPAH